MTIAKPMLATDFNESKLQFPICALPKIDGVRGIYLFGQLSITARTLKPFKNDLIATTFSYLPQGIDGELTFGSVTASDLCRQTTSVVNTFNHPATTKLRLYAFDYITPVTVDMPYVERHTILTKIAENLPRVSVIPITIINNIEELLAFEQTVVSAGYEGVILRDPNGIHKNGRTTVNEGTYLRIKRFIQEDAEVISIEEAVENTNEATVNALGHTERSTHKANLVRKGMVGSLICRDIKSGTIITVGPGAMTHFERKLYFNEPQLILGKTISYKHFPVGVKDKPRFPTFVVIRPSEDVTTE